MATVLSGVDRLNWPLKVRGMNQFSEETLYALSELICGQRDIGIKRGGEKAQEFHQAVGLTFPLFKGVRCPTTGFDPASSDTTLSQNR